MHTMESYLVIEKNKLLIHKTTWIGLKGIMLSEKTQYQKVTHYTILIIQYSRNDAIIVMKI